MSTTDSYPKREVLWRFKDSRSVSSERQDHQYCGFGWDAPIIDFYDNGYITEFAPLSIVLRDGPEKVMAAAFRKMEEKQFRGASPNVGGRGHRRMRWIHIPANNMEWVERVIECVWRAKKLEKAALKKKQRTKARREEQKTSDGASDSSLGAISERDDMEDTDDEYPMCLRPEYWRDQQRGRIEHCASHPLYARHMVPFFAPIPISVESATASKAEPKPKLKSRRKSARIEENAGHHETAQKANMVLFMPYIHWATSGNLMTERNTLIRMLAKAFKSEDYRRPREEDVNALNIAPKLKIMKAFLFPENDRCLHIRRTLDQFYYSTLPQAMVDERTNDQVVYRFAMKQQLKRKEELRLAKKQMLRDASREDRGAFFRDSSSQKTGNIKVEEIEEFLEQQKDNDEPPWDPPKVMMVNQLWMWVIDGDTVVTSFPAKLKSDLDLFKEKAEGKLLDGKDASDYTKGDKIYDSTDIWRAVFREFRFNTEHGKRSQKSALDLAWMIADQAAGVFHKRNIHPHLQFIEMFDMEINEIAFKQAEAFDTFITNVQLAHTANEIGKVLSSLDFFQKEMFAIKHVPDWRAKFRELSRYFNRKLEYIATCTDLKTNPNESTREVEKRIYVPPSPDEENERHKKTFSEELIYEYHQYAELLENSHAIKDIVTSLESAKADLGTSMDAVGSCIRESDTTEDEIHSVYAHLDHALQTLEDVGQSLKTKLINLQRAEEHLDHAISSLNNTKENLRSDTASITKDNLDFVKSHIEFAMYDLNYDIRSFLLSLFAKLEDRVEKASTTTSLNTDFDAFIQTAKRSLDAHTDMVMDQLFDIRIETSLVREIKDIIDELNIIQTIKRQQESVMDPFRIQMFQAVSEDTQQDFYDCTRLDNHVGQLRKTAETTYNSLRDLLDLKQKEASAIEARSASKDAKASAAQAEASTSLAAETVRQGWSIMVFTIVTIIFLPLSFFTSLFGMNAKEVLAGNFTLGFYSAIMWPISFVVICFSLGLALNVEFRELTLMTILSILRYTGLTRLWRSKLFTRGVFGKIAKAVERRKARRSTSSAYKKWEAGM